MNPVSRVCRNALCAPIRFYQRFISPGLGRNCRFTPTCSQYGIEAIQTHGCIKGLLLTAWRIARCNPLGRWGFDPVPPKGRWVSPERKLSVSKLFKRTVRWGGTLLPQAVGNGPSRVRGKSYPSDLYNQLLVTLRTVGGVSFS